MYNLHHLSGKATLVTFGFRASNSPDGLSTYMGPPRRNYRGDRGPMASSPGPRPSDTTRQIEPSLLRRQTLNDCVQQRRDSEAQLNREYSPDRPARLGKTPQAVQVLQQLLRADLERQLERAQRADREVQRDKKAPLWAIRY